ncbi:MAG TPA: enoyl-CoA hydratase-related protein [Syntrophomonadaceae bacterium]|nr:enoyl-CoA hydratase-related protein [Syntrophomonadaceae bacterium]HQE23435.1 enoyl-CoA hydratase-related protein [Syntrophomonadaceae bacterium]
MSYKTLDYTINGKIALITINRPEVLNALNGHVFSELKSAFEQAQTDPAVRAIILTGKGEKAFAAGSDIKEFADCSFYEARQISIRNNAAQQVIANCPKPTIAALNGYTLGGGLEVAMCCDIRIASENAKLGQPEIGLGFIPGGGGTQRLPRLIGVAKAKELIFSGKIITAQEALTIGLVNKVVPLTELIPESIAMAESFIKHSSVILEFAKNAIDTGIQLDLNSGLQLEIGLWAESFATEDHHEGIAAFIEKRKPEFKGK